MSLEKTEYKKNVVLAKTRNIQYPLLKYIEHFFYCDLYKDSKYKGLEFSDEFRLKKEFKTKEENPQSFRKNSHLIEIIANNYYMLNSFRRLKKISPIRTRNFIRENRRAYGHEIDYIFNVYVAVSA